MITGISGFPSIHYRFQYYCDEDKRFFRFPDEELLHSGMIFSHTEFRIIERIGQRLKSEEIAQKLFRSVNTLKTHRNDILGKSGRTSITEVIRDLKEQGLL
jgi:DNA-binding NarL/FixJ family response regulator